MLVSASNLLKFHNWLDEDDIELPDNLNILNIIKFSWSYDNRFLIFLEESGRPQILSLKDLNNIRPIHTITALDNASVVLFKRKTKNCVAIGTLSGNVALYDTQIKSIIKLFHVSSPVVSMDFNSQDKYLGIACSNGKISILNIMDEIETCNYDMGLPPAILIFHQTRINLFAVGTEEGTVFVYEVKHPKPFYVKQIHTDSIKGIVFTQKNNLITVGKEKFCIHDYGEQKVIFKSIMQYPLTCIDVTTDGKYFAIGTNIGKIFIFETENYLNPAIILNAHNSSISCIKYSNTPQLINTDSDSLIVFNTPQNNENNFEILCSTYNNAVEQNGFLKLYKSELLSNIEEYVEKLKVQIEVTIENLRKYIEKEFENINIEMNDKWDLLNLLSGCYIADEADSEHVYEDLSKPE